MTLTLEVPETVERTFREAARRRGVAPEKYFAELVQREAPGEAQVPESTLDALATNGTDAQSTLIAARLAAIAALPTHNTRAGLPELDLSGERADVYGYTEREDAQR